MKKELVTSLELSQKIDKLGVRVESEFWWQKWTQDEWKLSHYSDFNGINKDGVVEIDGLQTIKMVAEDSDEAYPALLTGELGMLLPNEVEIDDIDYFFCKRGQLHEYRSVKNDCLFQVQGTQPEPEARIKTLIYLIEQGLIKAEDLKL